VGSDGALYIAEADAEWGRAAVGFVVTACVMGSLSFTVVGPARGRFKPSKIGRRAHSVVAH